MLKAGIPAGSAQQLFYLMKKLKGKSKAKVTEALTLIHPTLMQNLKVSESGISLKNRRYYWMRRSGWAEVQV